MNHRPFTLIDAIRGIMHRKILVVTFFFSTLFLVGVFTLLTTKTYTSDSRLFLRLGRENAGLDATATMGDHPVVMMPQSREAEINSVVELLQSKQLYEQVVDQVTPERILESDWQPPGESGTPKQSGVLSNLAGNLLGWLASVGILNDLPARERAVIKLQKKTDVEAFEKSNVITVTCKSYSPELSQLLVAALVEGYVQQHVHLHRAPGAYEFLASETARIEESLLQRQADLEQFKNETGILSSDLQRAVLIQRISHLEAELLQTESEAAALETEVASLELGLASMSSTETTARTVGAGNEGVDGMRQELFKLEMAREAQAAKYTSDHPRMRVIEQQTSEAKQILSVVETDRVASVEGPSKVHQETKVTLLQKRPALAAIQAKRNKLLQQIETFNNALDKFTHSETQFAKLDREIAILDSTYRKYVSNLEQAKIDAKMESENFSNVGIAQPASLNLKPHSPNKLINLLAALVLGSCGGCGLAVMLEYFSQPVELGEQERPFRSPGITSLQSPRSPRAEGAVTGESLARVIHDREAEAYPTPHRRPTVNEMGAMPEASSPAATIAAGEAVLPASAAGDVQPSQPTAVPRSQPPAPIASRESIGTSKPIDAKPTAPEKTTDPAPQPNGYAKLSRSVVNA